MLPYYRFTVSCFNLLFIAVLFVFLLMDRTVCTRAAIIVLRFVSVGRSERILFASFAQEMARATVAPHGALKGTNGAQRDHPRDTWAILERDPRLCHVPVARPSPPAYDLVYRLCSD